MRWPVIMLSPIFHTMSFILFVTVKLRIIQQEVRHFPDPYRTFPAMDVSAGIILMSFG